MASTALSYSSIRTYLECPLRWKCLYVDRLPETPRGYFSFGRTVHAVLEELVRPLVVPASRTPSTGVSQRTLDAWHTGEGAPTGQLMDRTQLLEAYRRLWVSDGYVSADEETRYRQLGKDLLLRYHSALEETPPNPVAVEQHLEARWEGIPVHGYIDRIDRTPEGGLEVLDYKTSRELSAEDAEGSDQLTLYQVLVERNYSEPVEKLTLVHLRSLTPLRTPPRPKSALENLHERVGAVSDGIRSQAYEPTPGRHCSRCEFKSRCPEFREVPAADRERLTALVDRFARLRSSETELEQDLRATAEELHKEAERLGVHRVPGTRDVAIRRREESWSFHPDIVGPMLKDQTLPAPHGPLDSEALRRLIRDPAVDGELRRRVADSGGRKLRWFWELEDSGGRA